MSTPKSSIFLRSSSIYAGSVFSVSYAIGEFSSTIREMAPLYFNHVGHITLGGVVGFLAAYTIARGKRENAQAAEPRAVQKAAIIGGAVLGAIAIAVPEIPFIADALSDLAANIKIPLPGDMAFTQSKSPC